MIQDRLCKAVKAARNVGMSGRRCNFNLLTSIALQRLKTKQLVCLQTDKDGGFGVLSAKRFVEENAKILNNGDYVQIYRDAIPWNQLQKQILCVARSAAKTLDDKSVFGYIMKPWNMVHNPIGCMLKLTMKTHKPEIKFRNIHSSIGNRLSGLSGFVCKALGDDLKMLKHLLKDSVELAEQLRHVTVSEGDFFVKLDVDHFFMTGSAEFHAKLCKEFSPLVRKGVIFDAVLTLLEHQYVETPVWPEKIFQVTNGSGMGLSHSGEVSDCSFYQVCEQKLLHRLDEFEIKMYRRFKDDVFIIALSRPKFREFFRLYKAFSQPFAITCESVSKHECEMLELVISKHAGKLQVSQRVKKTALSVPLLNFESIHPSSSLASWPVSYVKHCMKLCSSKALARHAQNRLIHRFFESWYPQEFLKELCKLKVGQPKADPSKMHNVGLCCYLVMGFCPTLEPFIKKALHELSCDPDVQSLLRIAFCGTIRLQISWSNQLFNLNALLSHRGGRLGNVVARGGGSF